MSAQPALSKHALYAPLTEVKVRLDADSPGVAIPEARHLKLLDLAHPSLWEKHQHANPASICVAELAEATQNGAAGVSRGGYQDEVVAHWWDAVGEELGHQLQGKVLKRGRGTVK